MSDTINPETLDLIYEHTRNAPARQVSSSHQLDSKAVQLFSASTVVVGLVAIGPITTGPPAIFFVLALVAYTLVAYHAFCVLVTRDVRVTDNADEIWPVYWNQSAFDTKHALTDDIASAYTENAELLEDKAGHVGALVLFASLEAILVALAVLVALY